jgi:hypothetical protein
MSMKRKMLWAGAVLGIVVIATGGFTVYRIGPRNVIGMLRYDQREEGTLKVGDPAPDVVLDALDGGKVHLRERLGAKPVVLVFGSYT